MSYTETVTWKILPEEGLPNWSRAPDAEHCLVIFRLQRALAKIQNLAPVRLGFYEFETKLFRDHKNQLFPPSAVDAYAQMPEGPLWSTDQQRTLSLMRAGDIEGLYICRCGVMLDDSDAQFASTVDIHKNCYTEGAQPEGAQPEGAQPEGAQPEGAQQ